MADTQLQYREGLRVAPLVREQHLVLATIAAFLVPVTAAVAMNVALGYDEAVYAELARHLVTGAPGSGWGIHRPPGLSLLATLPMLAGLTESVVLALRQSGLTVATGQFQAMMQVSLTNDGPVTLLLDSRRQF